MTHFNNVELFRARLVSGDFCLGQGVALSDPMVSEIIAHAGYDFVFIDAEHGYLGLDQILGHIMAVRGTDCAALVRVPSWNPNDIKPILDLAPAAVLVPQITNADEVQTAVRACKYPPVGTRGFGPIRNMGHGDMSQAEYLKIADRQIMVFVQIETAAAVADIDAIIAVPNLDGILIGRNDLSGSYGKLGQFDDPEVKAAIDTVIAKVAETDLFLGAGLGFDRDTITDWAARGVRWFCLNADFANLATQSRSVAEQFRKLVSPS